MKIRNTIVSLGKYTPPLEGRNPDDYLLMDFNESPLPPPKHVIERLTDFINSKRLQVYPSYGDFLELLGKYTGYPAESLIVTNGSDQAIDITLRCLLEPEDEMVMAKPGFAMFFQVAGTIGCRVITPKYNEDLSFPLEEVKKSVTTKTRLIVVINPNNPTGTSATLGQIEDLLRSFPDVGILVDEAYFEFTEKTCASLLNTYPNLIILRTFSKAFAIPSLRLGYVIAKPDFIQHLYKIRGPYDVNMIAIIAAKAQLEQPEPLKEMIFHIMKKSKPVLEQFFYENGIKFFNGDANFMLVAPDNVIEVIEFLKQNGILVRPMHPPIAHTFRMSAGTLEQTQKFIKVYKKFLAKK